MINDVGWFPFSWYFFCFILPKKKGLQYKLEKLTQASNSIWKIRTQVYRKIHTFLRKAAKIPHCTLLHHWNYFLMHHVWLCWNVNHQQPENNSKQGQLMLSALTARVHGFHGRKHTRWREKNQSRSAFQKLFCRKQTKKKKKPFLSQCFTTISQLNILHRFSLPPA